MTEPGRRSASPLRPLTFSYSLRGLGWAEADVTAGKQAAHLSASYLSDALPSLLEAIDGLWNGDLSAECYWAEEPGYYRWDFGLVDGDQVRLRILAEAHTRGLDAQLSRADGGPLRQEAEGSQSELLILDIQLSLLDLTEGITNGAAETLTTFGPVSYLEMWRSSRFPLARLRQVQSNAGLPPVALPQARQSVVDPQVAELWGAFLAGHLTAEETAARLDEDSPAQNEFSPLETWGRRRLKGLASQGELTGESAETARQGLAAWCSNVERYERDPMEWHRCEALVQLAEVVRFTKGQDLTSANGFEALLDPSDIKAMVNGMGY